MIFLFHRFVIVLFWHSQRFFNCVFPNYFSFQMQSQWVLLLRQVCQFLPIVASLNVWKKPLGSSVSTFAIGYNLPKIAQKYTFRPILQIYWQKKETFSSNIRLVFKNNSCIGHYLVLCCCPKVVLTVLLKKQVLDNRWRLLVPRHKNFDSVGTWLLLQFRLEIPCSRRGR